MSYMHIANLYKDQTILQFKRCFALEKIHGTSAHVSWSATGGIKFFAGGVKHADFVSLFSTVDLFDGFQKLGAPEVTVYGEAYGGKCQGMSETYGKSLRFVAFEVKIGESWLSVPNAEDVVKKLGLEFVHYVDIPADLIFIDEQRDAPSVQAVRNGMGEHIREGVVLRPPFEVTKSSGGRVISKHKRDEFKETKTKREVDPSQVEVLKDAQKIADEWVTEMRLDHILNGSAYAIEQTGDIIQSMFDDIGREATGEIVMSKEAKRLIGTKTAIMFKKRLIDTMRGVKDQ